MQPKKVEMYQCGECSSVHADESWAVACGKEHESQRRAIRIAQKRAAIKERIRDRVRLEATSLSHMRSLIEEYSLKYFGLKVTFQEFPRSFQEVSNSHSAPIGKPTNWGRRDPSAPTTYKGWSGSIKGKIEVIDRAKYSKNESPSLKDIFADTFSNDGFRGFHTSSGSFGSNFSGGFNFFLDDFPLLKVAYERYQQLDQRRRGRISFNADRAKRTQEQAEFALNLDAKASEMIAEKVSLQAQVIELNKKIQDLSTKIAQKRDVYLTRIDTDPDWLPMPDEVKFDENEWDRLVEDFIKY